MNIRNALKRYERASDQASIAMNCAGYVAAGAISTQAQTPGVSPVVIKDCNIEKTVQDSLDEAYSESDIVESDCSSALANAINIERPVVTQFYSAIKDLPKRAVVEAMGFDVDTLLNCKLKMETSQTPCSGVEFVSRDSASDIMTTAFGTGTWMQVEQAVVASASGIEPSVRGMHGIETTETHVLPDCAATQSEGNLVHFTLESDSGAGVSVIACQPHVAEGIGMALRDLSGGENRDCIGDSGFYGYFYLDCLSGTST